MDYIGNSIHSLGVSPRNYAQAVFDRLYHGLYEIAEPAIMALLAILHRACLAGLAGKPVNPSHIFLNEFIRITLGLKINVNMQIFTGLG